MANAYKTLGQSAPAATTLTDVYIAAIMAICSSIVVCNRGAAGSYRIAVSPLGAAIANQHYLFYDVAIDANSSEVISMGLGIAPTDRVRVYASHANMGFTLSGVEIS